ncbi:uncharacterized protein AC631_05346 [Debaryomyces fabryi]|uniref:Elongator complex protein 6 n=1 Tax=Debaryomyces fabryi TaxID=58627 RepID=A0A0V1PSB9_9ASCO|nr:uncharacterized protein AC631_05346 [Debaryomyces fabryi]KRZ98894.1 hypothetical protein AC631_05346 [Debaryomyces fabryi]CUM54560.1 unnamed protein product [Debaryomyces fabryi]
MATSQQQDLVFFNDNSLISNGILKSSSSHCSIISHVQGTSPTWLINSLLENSLIGTACLVNNDLNRKIPDRSEVYFISFSHPKDFYIKNCKKNGLDLSLLSNFKFIDCFSDLFLNKIKNPNKASGEVSKLFENIINEINASGNTNKVIFIESIEILLAATNIESKELLKQCFKINKLCRQLFVIVAQDYPQVIDLSASIPQDSVFKISDFLLKLYHRSQLNLNLQPLPTGRANDITGCITISKGAIPYENIEGVEVIEKEYIYYVNKESSIKLFFR